MIKVSDFLSRGKRNNTIRITFWIAVIVEIIFLIRWTVVSAGAGGPATGSEDFPPGDSQAKLSPGRGQ